MTQLPQRFRFDLADALARYVEDRSDLLQGPRAAVTEPEPKSDDLLLAARERRENVRHLLLEHGERRRVRRVDGGRVLDEIAKVRILVFADRAVQRDRFLRRLQHRFHLLHRHPELLRHLFRQRLATVLLNEPTRRPHDLVDRLDHVHGDADRPRLIRNGACDGLTDPPRRVRRKLVPFLVVELVNRTH